MELFENIVEAPLDPILGLNYSYALDRRESKVNLGAGVYKTAELKSFILNTVKRAERLLLEKETTKDYLPIDGLSDYVEATKTLVFGKKEELQRVYGAQAVGGTAALSVGSRLLKELGLHKVYLSNPTWANHHRIFHHAGFEVHTYPYFSWEKKGFDFSGMMEALDRMEEKSIVLLQLCCHNPSGCDPTLSQWKEIYEKLEQKQLFPFFDFAYQGFGEGLEQDTAPLELFMQTGQECALAVSHAKNFGLYSERVGALFMVCRHEESAKRVGTRIRVIIRSLYSNPPRHGARVVATILHDEVLRKHWEHEVATMRERIGEMRKALTAGLQLKTTKTTFDFLTTQKGMFSYTGLNEKQVARLIADYGIYLPKDGRINIAGLNSENLDYVLEAILAVGSS